MVKYSETTSDWKEAYLCLHLTPILEGLSPENFHRFVSGSVPRMFIALLVLFPA